MYVVEEHLRDPQATDIAKEFITEFMESTLKGDSFGQSNDQVTKEWMQKVKAEMTYLVDLKSNHCKIQLKKQH